MKEYTNVFHLLYTKIVMHNGFHFVTELKMHFSFNFRKFTAVLIVSNI